MLFQYHTSGLNIASEIELPKARATFESPDITVRLGQVPDELPQVHGAGACFQAAPNQFLLKLDKIAKYLAKDGKEIIVEPVPGAAHQDIIIFLVGSALGAIYHQRGLLPLHGSAVEVHGQGVLFMGTSGSGKSTLAAAFQQNGYRILNDDISVITPGASNKPLVQPGFPYLKLWEDALEHFGTKPGTLQQTRQQVNKYYYPLPENGQEPQPLPVKQLYVLTTKLYDANTIEPLNGEQKFVAIRRNVYKARHLQGLGMTVPNFKQCHWLSQHVPVSLLHRARDIYNPAALVDTVLKDLGS